jgi:hypothetical protein
MLLLATLQIPRVAWLYVHALKVADEDLPEILLAINQVPGQVVEPGPGCVSQVSGAKLDDEEVVIHPVRPTYKAVILQPHVGAGFAIILDNVV